LGGRQLSEATLNLHHFRLTAGSVRQQIIGVELNARTL
jgi:hypothetical protein